MCRGEYSLNHSWPEHGTPAVLWDAYAAGSGLGEILPKFRVLQQTTDKGIYLYQKEILLQRGFFFFSCNKTMSFPGWSPLYTNLQILWFISKENIIGPIKMSVRQHCFAGCAIRVRLNDPWHIQLIVKHSKKKCFFL